MRRSLSFYGVQGELTRQIRVVRRAEEGLQLDHAIQGLWRIIRGR